MTIEELENLQKTTQSDWEGCFWADWKPLPDERLFAMDRSVRVSRKLLPMVIDLVKAVRSDYGHCEPFDTMNAYDKFVEKLGKMR